MSDATREAIAGDLEFDPTFAHQRSVTPFIIGMLINHLRDRRPPFAKEYDNLAVADDAEKVCRKLGILPPPDGLHHAPACPANLWSGQVLPISPCTCGAKP